MADLQEQLDTQEWVDTYYAQSFPIVRLLGDLMLGGTRKDNE